MYARLATATMNAVTRLHVGGPAQDLGISLK